mgnify:CR=1 FL=1
MTRHAEGTVYRRRVCKACNKGWYTAEMPVDGLPKGVDRTAGSMNAVRLARKDAPQKSQTRAR